jgi:UDP-N-acetylmuramoylalanine--D-glutamate ligase
MRRHRPFDVEDKVRTYEEKLEAFRGRRVLVVGLGRSGVAAARALAPAATEVVACDEKPADELSTEARELAGAGVALRLGDQTAALLAGMDLLVRSPGVPWEAPLIVAAREKGIEVVGELELAYRLLTTERVVAVTGSNGKSTTTALLGEIFRRAGEDVVVAGNIGVALTAVGAEIRPTTTVVAEVSSFQLEDAVTFRPRVAVLLNLAPDHLDRHGSPAAYYRMKWRLFENQRPEDYAVLNADEESSGNRDELQAAVLLFGRGAAPGPGVWLAGDDVACNVRMQKGTLLPNRDIRLPGFHNLSNAMAAACAALAMDVSPPAIAEALREFEGLPHRLEFVGEAGGVRYVNDSKATNVASALTALATFEGPIILIAGGKSKGGDFGALAAAARGRVRLAVLYGAARDELAAAFGSIVPLERVDTIGEAVAKAAASVRRGDVVLLSPACTSWDQYRDFEERGDDFKRAVAELSREAS